MLVWDNLSTHLTAGMRRCIADRDWLTVVQLPPYATDLNPVEGIRSVLRRTTTANRAFADPDDLITAVRRNLRQLQYRANPRRIAIGTAGGRRAAVSCPLTWSACRPESPVRRLSWPVCPRRWTRPHGYLPGRSFAPGPCWNSRWQSSSTRGSTTRWHH
ncbi:transposase [Streptomyces ardesiacus]|uniref:transposase n=1 Tax=unclassified Streptomyces TaxID=2593676 RepID=UPI003B637D09